MHNLINAIPEVTRKGRVHSMKIRNIATWTAQGQTKMLSEFLRPYFCFLFLCAARCQSVML